MFPFLPSSSIIVIWFRSFSFFVHSCIFPFLFFSALSKKFRNPFLFSIMTAIILLVCTHSLVSLTARAPQPTSIIPTLISFFTLRNVNVYMIFFSTKFTSTQLVVGLARTRRMKVIVHIMEVRIIEKTSIRPPDTCFDVKILGNPKHIQFFLVQHRMQVLPSQTSCAHHQRALRVSRETRSGLHYRVQTRTPPYQ